MQNQIPVQNTRIYIDKTITGKNSPGKDGERKAATYFSKLIDEYPDSMWSYDAYIKIKKIEYFNMFYRKILLNIERKLKEKKSLYTVYSINNLF